MIYKITAFGTDSFILLNTLAASEQSFPWFFCAF